MFLRFQRQQKLPPININMNPSEISNYNCDLKMNIELPSDDRDIVFDSIIHHEEDMMPTRGSRLTKHKIRSQMIKDTFTDY